MPCNLIRGCPTAIGLLIALSAAWPADAEQPPKPIPSRRPTTMPRSTIASGCWPSGPSSGSTGLAIRRRWSRRSSRTTPCPADYYVPTTSARRPKYPAVICLHILDGNEALTDLVCSVLAGRAFRPSRSSCPTTASAAARGGRKPWPTIPNGSSAPSPRPAKTCGARSICWPRGRRSTRADRHHRHQPRRDHRRHGRRRRAAAAPGGPDPGRRRSAGHHPSCPRNPAARARCSPSSRQQSGRPSKRSSHAVDPLRFAPAVRDRARAGKVLMINAARRRGDSAPVHRETGRGPGHRRSRGLARRVGPLHGDGRIAPALRITADFFAQDLPGGRSGDARARRRRADRSVAAAGSVVAAGRAMLAVEPATGRCHFAELELVGRAPITGRSKGTRAAGPRRAGPVLAALPACPESAKSPWAKAAFPGCSPAGNACWSATKHRRRPRCATAFSDVEPRQWMKLPHVFGPRREPSLAPEMLQQWIDVSERR